MAGTQQYVEALTGLVAETVLTVSSDQKNSLEGIDVSGLVDRATCYVREVSATYRYFDTSVVPVLVPFVVAPAVGPGRWIQESIVTEFRGGKITAAIAQSIPNATNTVATFSTAPIDAGGYADLANERLVIPVADAGLYQVGAAVRWASHGQPNAFERMIIAGSVAGTILFIGSTSTTEQAFAGSTLIALAPSETVDLQVFQDSGVAVDLLARELWAYRVG